MLRNFHRFIGLKLYKQKPTQKIGSWRASLAHCLRDYKGGGGGGDWGTDVIQGGVRAKRKRS